MSSSRDKERNAFLVSGLKTERMKTFSETISGSDNRIKFLYEAPADTLDQGECLKTVYVYIGTSSSPLYSKEVPGTWLASFETDALAKAQSETPPYTLE